MFPSVILVAGSIPFLLADAGLPAAQQPAKFDGIWDGHFVDNNQDSGKGQYQFHEEKAGKFTVTVTWWDKKTNETKEMTLVGERLGPDALRMTGKYKDTTYRYIGSLEGIELVLNYRSIDAKGQMSGFGVSRLTRQAKKAP